MKNDDKFYVCVHFKHTKEFKAFRHLWLKVKEKRYVPMKSSIQNWSGAQVFIGTAEPLVCYTHRILLQW